MMIVVKLPSIQKNYGNLLLFIYAISINIFFTEKTQVIGYIITMIFISIVFLKTYLDERVNHGFKINYILISFLIFIVLGLFSLIWSVTKYQTLNKSISLILVFATLFFLYNLIIIKSIKVEYFLYGIITSFWINFLLLILSKVGVIGEDMIFFDGRFIGTKTNANEIGYVFVYATFSVMFFLNKSRKRFSFFWSLSMLLIIYLSILTGSKKTIIGLVILLVGYQFHRIRTYSGMIKLLLILFSLLLVLQNSAKIISYVDSPYVDKTYARFERAFLEFNNSEVKGSTNERLALVNMAISKIKEKPLLGHGLNSFTYYSRIYTHSNYLEILTGLGFVGLITFYTMHVLTFLKSYHSINESYRMKWLLIVFMFTILLIDITAVNYYNKLYYSMLIVLPFLRFDSFNFIETK